MKSVILCEGKDDVWFIAYYLHKCAGWMVDEKATRWKNAKIPADHKQTVTYLLCPQNADTTAIVSVGGQDRMKKMVSSIAYLNSSYPSDPIQALVLFRDCDQRDSEALAASMGAWFSPPLELHNHIISTYYCEIDEIPFFVRVLPVVIPFDETGAIETLLLKSIGERSQDGAHVVNQATSYVDTVKQNVSEFLKSDRLIVKAKYSAAIAITNPDHSTALFQDLMMSTEWENCESIKKHFIYVLDAITGC